MLTGGPGQLDRLGDQGGLGARCRELHDLSFVLGVLVADGDPAGPVVQRHRQPGGAHRVVRVHGRDQPEALVGGNAAQPRHVDLALGHDGEQNVDGLFGDPVELLDVQQPAIAHGPHQRPVGEVLRAVPLLEHERRVEGPDEAGRGQLGAALNQDEFGVPGRRDLPQQGGLAGARRPFEQDVGARRERGPDQLQLALAPDYLFGQCGQSVLVNDDAADVLAGHQVVIALVDLFQLVRPGDDLVELEVAGLVQAEDLGNVGGRVAVAEQAALDRLSEQGHDRSRHGNGRYLQLVQPSHDDGAALADGVEPGGHDLGRHEVDGEDGRVGHLPPGHLGYGRLRLFGGGERVSRAEFHRLLALVLQRVDGDDVLRAGVAGALHRVDADAADAVDRHRVAGRDVRGVHGGAPAGRHAAANQHGLVQRQVVIDLDGRGLADHAVLAEGPDHAHGTVLAAGPGEGEPLTGQVALEDRRAHVADRLAAGGAVAADAAVRDEGQDHVVAGFHPGHARPDLLDDPGALVAKHHRQPRRQIAVRDVDVGVAQARVGVADQDLTILRAVQVELFDLDALTGLVDDSGLGLHRRSFGLSDGPNSSPASGR